MAIYLVDESTQEFLDYYEKKAGILSKLFTFNLYKFRNIKLKIENNILTIIRMDQEILNIYKEEIIKIEETKNGNIFIRLMNDPKKILINRIFKNFENLYDDLNKMMKIEKSNKCKNIDMPIQIGNGPSRGWDPYT